MSSTPETPSVVPHKIHCLICNSAITVSHFSLNKQTQFFQDKGKVSKLFCRLACRYMNFKCGDIKPEKTISVNQDDDKIDQLCENCFPLAESFCEIYHEFKYFEQLFHWQMKQLIDSIHGQMADSEHPEEKQISDFRTKFKTRGNQQQNSKRAPKLLLDRLPTKTEKLPPPKPSNSNQNKETSANFACRLPKKDTEKNLQASTFSNSSDQNQETSANFGCRFCPLAFGSLVHLETHESKAHLASGSKDVYGCKICGKQFSRKRRLSYHMRIHREKLHQCTSCDKKFSKLHNLYRHIESESHLEYVGMVTKSTGNEIVSHNAAKNSEVTSVVNAVEETNSLLDIGETRLVKVDVSSAMELMHEDEETTQEPVKLILPD